MGEIIVTIKLKRMKFRTYINLMKLISFVSIGMAYKMLDLLKINLDKFYTAEM